MKKNKIIIIVLATAIIGVVTYLSINYLMSGSAKESRTYTPSLSLEKIGGFERYLPYEGQKFSVRWNKESNQLETTIHKPYVENSADLLNWLADHEMNNLPPDMLKIVRD